MRRHALRLTRRVGPAKVPPVRQAHPCLNPSTLLLPTVWPRAVPTSVARCLLLAMLLHLWLLLILGSAPGGTARRGEGVWGAINITLHGPVTPNAPAAAPVPAVAPQAPVQRPALRPAPTALPMPVPAPVPAAVLAPVPVPLPISPPAPAPTPPVPEPAPERNLSSTLAREPALPVEVPRLESAAPAAVAPRPMALPPRLNELAAPPLPPAPLSPAAPLLPSDAAASPATSAVPVIGPGPGAPDAGTRIGQDLATPASTPASAPPRLNLQLARPRGGELSRGGAMGLLPLLPRPPDLPDKLAKDIDKSGKPDCRTAYAGAGLLAVIPLAVDAVRKDSGCKW